MTAYDNWLLPPDPDISDEDVEEILTSGDIAKEAPLETLERIGEIAAHADLVSLVRLAFDDPRFAGLRRHLLNDSGMHGIAEEAIRKIRKHDREAQKQRERENDE